MQTTGGITFTSGMQFTPWVPPGLQGIYSYRLTNPNINSTAAGDFFGGGAPGSTSFTYSALALSDSYIIVGAPGEENSSNANQSGKAYLFNLSDGSLKYTFSNANSSGAYYYGAGVAVTNSYAVVGVPEPTSGFMPGSVYTYSIATGAQTGRLQGPSNYSLYGIAVAAANTSFVVGAPNKATNVSGGGGAYVYYAANNALRYTVLNPQISTGNNYGKSVACTDTHFLIGSGGTYAGLYSMATGNLLYTLSDAGAYYGSVGMSSSYSIVGASGWPIAANSTGVAYIYSNTTGAKLRTLYAPVPKANEGFGKSVSISEKYAAVGTEEANGNVYLFSVETGNLVTTFRNTQDATPANGNDYFGRYLTVNADVLAIAAPNDNSGSGNVYIYK